MRLKAISIITLPATSKHFSVYFLKREQASRPRLNRERLQQNVAETNYRKSESHLGRSVHTALPLTGWYGGSVGKASAHKPEDLNCVPRALWWVERTNPYNVS